MKKLFKAVIWFTFCLYVVILVKAILFKFPLQVVLNDWVERDLIGALFHSQFIPFKTISEYLLGGGNVNISLRNLLGNLIGFMPLGFFLPVLSSKFKKLRKIVITSFGTSLTFESVQLIVGVGSFDVDDLIMNTLGAVFGYFAFRSLLYIAKRLLKTPIKQL